MAERYAIRVLVCGGRHFNDVGLVERTLDALAREHVIDCIIEGNARGADRIAGYWARRHRISNVKLIWQNGLAAGPIRNQRMLDNGKPDLVIAFPGGAGTADMVRRAEAAGIRVVEVA